MMEQLISFKQCVMGNEIADLILELCFQGSQFTVSSVKHCNVWKAILTGAEYTIVCNIFDRLQILQKQCSEYAVY